MRKFFKRALSALLVAVMLLGAAPVFGLADTVNLKASAADTGYQVGDIIKFGSYPQSRVTDSATLNALNSLSLDWISYGYYSGTGSVGTMISSDYMKYADVEYEGNRYRAVRFSQYRPYYTCIKNSDGTFQDDNGYNTNTTYWFKYDPIYWRILDLEKGLILSETIVDSQPYSNTLYYANDYYWNNSSYTIYANNYATSSIRKWLNDDFYKTAFTSMQELKIKTTKLDNSAYSSSYAMFDSVATNDKIFLLSWDEVLNTNYGFVSDSSAYDISRIAKGSDYAKCQGLHAYDGADCWRLRSAGYLSENVCNVFNDGNVDRRYDVTFTSGGIRPAMCINLTPGICVFSTEKSFNVEVNEKMSLAFCSMLNFSDDTNVEWEKMSIVVSDPTVVSVSDYKKTSYGYAVDVTGKKAGKTYLTVSNVATGENIIIEVSVVDKYVNSYSYAIDNMPEFYPYNFSDKILTNIYDLNGIYVNNYKCNKVSGGYNVSFDAFSENAHTGAVDIYDKNGNWIGSKEIKKHELADNIWKVGEEVFYLASDWITHKLITYEQHSFATKTEDISFFVPEGGYFEISQNIMRSPGTLLSNALEVVFEGLTIYCNKPSLKDYKYISRYREAVLNKILTDEEINKAFMSAFKSAAESEIKSFAKGFSTGNLLGGSIELTSLLENILAPLNVDLKKSFEIATGVGEDALKALSGPLGIALEGCFKFIDFSNKLSFALSVALSTDNVFATVYSAENGSYVTANGVVVHTNGNVDKEAFLQVFRVSESSVPDFVVDPDNPYSHHELYNISFVKNDNLVQPNGKVKVYLPIPEGMNSNTCVVYRQESDGRWTILHAKVEGNYVVFETDHFSLYAIAGETAEIEIASLPNKLGYNSGDVLDLTGFALNVDGKEITSGYICNPAVISGSGAQTVTVSYGTLSAQFTVYVQDMNIEEEHITMNYNQSVALNTAINMADNAEYTVEYITDNAEVATVDESGNVHGNMKGAATITCKVTDSNGNVYTDTCTIEVKFNFWQWLLYIICFGWIWM